MSGETRKTEQAKPAFGARKLLMVITGAIQSVHLPYWLTWLRSGYPDLEIRAIVTRSALRFTTKQAVSALTSNEVYVDEWPDDAAPTALHVDLGEWADAIAVYPASLHYLSRAATGLADSPSMVIVHAASIPIGFAPSLPPGVEDNPVHQRNLKLLGERSNVVISATQRATSVTTGRSDARGAAPLPVLLRDIEEMRAELARKDENPKKST
ncbi:flavoprotein [Amycolatopsis sp. NPDC059657]|uniref:flavoprotein n=1 Tax=Amycolatopsis sp. NPDC059657 TaxID=3346899 RepID=UPI003670EB27